MSHDFAAKVQRLRILVDEAAESLHALGLSEEIAHIQAGLAREEFRIAILGRFKTGKSSTVNALLGDDIVPADILPCTAGAVELIRGNPLAFWELANGTAREATRDHFLREVGGATRASGAAGRWRVEVPCDWLLPGMVLVDTPGSNEDEARNALAQDELSRADAAVVVVAADQVASLDELDLVDGIRQRVGLVIVVVNRIDTVPPQKRAAVLTYLSDRFAELGVPTSRILPLAATRARSGEPGAVDDLAAIRQLLASTLASGPAGARVEATRTSLNALMLRLQPAIAVAVQRSSAKAEEAHQAVSYANGAHRDASQSLAAVEAIWTKTGDSAASRAGDAVAAGWPRLVADLVKGRAGWDGSSDPLFSPKAFAGEVAECAQRDMKKLLGAFTQQKLQPVIATTLAQAGTQIDSHVSAVLGDRVDTGALLADAVGNAFPEAAAGAGGTEAAVAAAVSAIVGYIIADVILYYLLALIAGFLNPVLLIGAAVTGFAAYFFMGRDWLAETVRDRIADKLSAELLAETRIREIRRVVETQTREAVARVARSHSDIFRRRAQDAEEAMRRRGRDAVAAAEALTLERETARAAMASLDRMQKEAEVGA